MNFLDMTLAQYSTPAYSGAAGVVEVVNTAGILCLVLAGSEDDRAKVLLDYLGKTYKSCRGQEENTIIARLSNATYHALRYACQIPDQHISDYIEAILKNTPFTHNLDAVLKVMEGRE